MPYTRMMFVSKYLKKNNLSCFIWANHKHLPDSENLYQTVNIPVFN